ncbi:hypothetical protein RhiJN_03588 [Ceratobasidium sp. AG-Ba]|nr:hypothetical protein RhiJN_03588 [Ceratobasidium sp. AG-Ba]QRW04487.1 hypothetical protein RhiLY_03486 [Ceratobasidium sp. AG-Ba]
MSMREPYYQHSDPQPGISCLSDSDLEPPLSFSDLTSPNETENDTPPETPLRDSLLDGPEILKSHRAKDNTATGFKTVHVAEPLIVATPHPIRPPLPSFRTFSVAEQDNDRGYDSERETFIRPLVPRFRSFRRASEVARSSPLTTPSLGTSSGAFWNANKNFSPVQKRPRHPPPLDLPSRHDIGVQTDSAVSPLEQLLDDPRLDHAALWRGLISTGIPFRLNKDRSNQATRLGRGLPSGLAQDTSRVPTVVPDPASGLYPRASSSTVEWNSTIRPHRREPRPSVYRNSRREVGLSNQTALVVDASKLGAPVIAPLKISDEDEMSPLVLPEPVLAGLVSPEEHLLLQFTQGGGDVDPSTPHPATVLSEDQWAAHLNAMLVAELNI